MLAQGFCLLSDQDRDALGPPAVATVSTLDQSWDSGGWGLGSDAAARGGLWVDRPYFTGNPTVDWFVQKANLSAASGAFVQVGNEQNLGLEGWHGGPQEWFAFEDAVRARVAFPDTLLAMPPSPGVADWTSWVRRQGDHAAHVYGGFEQLRSGTQWYLDNTDGAVFVTELNPGAGQTFDLDAWANADLVQYLDWAASHERIRLAAYFAWAWDQSATLPSSIDARGTAVETIIRDWTPPINGGAGVPDIDLSVPTRVQMASPENYQAGPRARTLGVVLHTTRGGGRNENEFPATINWFANPDAGVSAHLVVGSPPFDEVCRSVHDDDIAWHARSANQTHLGLEICQATIATPIGDFAYRAAAEACRKWSIRYGFPLVRRMTQTEPGLVGHEDTESGKLDHKSDPGVPPAGVFDWDRFIALCRAGGTPVQPTDPTALRDRTYALADQLQRLGPEWESYGYPQMAEYCRTQGEAVKKTVVIQKGEK